MRPVRPGKSVGVAGGSVPRSCPQPVSTMTDEHEQRRAGTRSNADGRRVRVPCPEASTGPGRPPSCESGAPVGCRPMGYFRTMNASTSTRPLATTSLIVWVPVAVNVVAYAM